MVKNQQFKTEDEEQFILNELDKMSEEDILDIMSDEILFCDKIKEELPDIKKSFEFIKNIPVLSITQSTNNEPTKPEVKKLNKSNSISHEELKDRLIGAVGTPDRDDFENQIKLIIEEHKVLQELEDSLDKTITSKKEFKDNPVMFESMTIREKEITTQIARQQVKIMLTECTNNCGLLQNIIEDTNYIIKNINNKYITSIDEINESIEIKMEIDNKIITLSINNDYLLKVKVGKKLNITTYNDLNKFINKINEIV
jgi:hypothetical protein